jgi:hypothetical protein
MITLGGTKATSSSDLIITQTSTTQANFANVQLPQSEEDVSQIKDAEIYILR